MNAPARGLSASHRTHRRMSCRAEAMEPSGHVVQHSRRVAVIGAGAAGLASARELLREGHHVVVFEQGPALGGTWIYEEATDSDPGGRQPGRRRVHSSMYRNLRTNLPREVMSFRDLPFVPQAMSLVAAGAHAPETAHYPAPCQGSQSTSVQGSPSTPRVGPCESVDARRYPSHQEVLRYLHAYTTYYGLMPYVQLNTQVVSASPLEQPQQREALASQEAGQAGHSQPIRWVLQTKSQSDRAPPSTAAQGNGQVHPSSPAQPRTWEFDALVVANGHYTEPSLPDIPGMDACSVPQLHSHNYREPQPFSNQVVLVVGASNSGEDISRELSGVASRVLLSARTWKEGEAGPDTQPYGDRNNIYRYPIPERLTPDGHAVFPGGVSIRVDAIIYATGYLYSFPFLDATPQAPVSQGVSVEVQCQGRYVAPLYRHMFPASPLAPWLAFIGLPWRVIPFPQVELQARVVARALSGRVQLPSPEAMARDTERHFQAMREAGVHERFAHMQHMQQFAYNAELAAMCGDDGSLLPTWREDMYKAGGDLKRAHPGAYRDAPWTDVDPVLQRMQADTQQQLTGMKAGVLQPQDADATTAARL